MISFPDDLLEEVDRVAARHSESRSGFLQRLARDELSRTSEERRAQLERLLGEPKRQGGNAAALIRESREER